MRLTKSQIADILDVELEVWQVDLEAMRRNREKGGFEYVWAPIQELLMKALRKAKSTPRNNPLVWWIAVLARSAVSDDNDRDFISRGRFHKNPMPMDVDLGERLLYQGCDVLEPNSRFDGPCMKVGYATNPCEGTPINRKVIRY